MSWSICPCPERCPLKAEASICRDPPREYIELGTWEPQGACLLYHIMLALDSWRKAKIRHIPAMARVFSVHKFMHGPPNPDEVDRMLSLAIAFHDLGKSSDAYQEPRPTRYETPFRHEFLSAALAYNYCVNMPYPIDVFAPIIAGAVLIHHESRLLRTLRATGSFELRWEHVEGCLRDRIQLRCPSDLESFLSAVAGSSQRGFLKNAYTREEVIESICQILGQLNTDLIMEPWWNRLMAANLGSIIVICDNIAAAQTRSNEKHRISAWLNVLERWGRGFR